MENKDLTCICCPLGCQLNVKLIDGNVDSVTGNGCKRGAEYGKKEVTNPTRIVTTSVVVLGSDVGAVSVKTASDIPKGKIFDCIRDLKNVQVKAPVYIGDVILKNVANTGVDVIATKNVI